MTPLRRRTVLAGIGLAPLLVPTAFAQESGSTALHGLVIGNDRYTKLRKLERAVSDARSIAARIRSFGYDVTEAYDADTEAVFAAFAAFRERLVGDAAAFVYFAGHGLQVNGTNYLIPVDADNTTDDRMLETSLPLSPLLDDLAATRPAQAILMLDACRNNLASATISGARPGFASVQAPGGFYIAYSAGSGELALDTLGDDDRDPNGVFTRFFLKNVAPDRPIDAIMKDTRCQVASAAEAIGHPQHPAIYDQSRADLRLDARRDFGSARVSMCATGIGRLSGTAVLLIANQDYAAHTRLNDLKTPRSDVRHLERTFRALGAATRVVEEAGVERIREACVALAKERHERIVLHYAGMGELVGNDATLFLVNPAAPASKSAKAAAGSGASAPIADVNDDLYAGLEFLFLEDIVEWLRPPPVKARPDTTRAVSPRIERGPKIVFLLDFCLFPHKVGVEPKVSVLAALQSGNDRYGHVSVLTGGGIFQAVLDAAPGHSKSPFTIAIDNALARPGLSIGQFAAVVRDEVEAITKGVQTPTLFALPERRGDRFVERLPPLDTRRVG